MNLSDQKRAKRLLEFRSDKTRSPLKLVFQCKKLWIGIILAPILLAVAINSESLVDNRIAFIFLGILVGRLGRDFIWIKDSCDGFPFIEKVLNWDEVDRIAEDK